jgi:3',5'-cyclic AMP phosphodiesterase CpdA
LEGDGGTDLKQIDWLTKTLKTIAKQPGKALIIATHHPPFSQSTTAAARKCCRPSMPHAPPRVYSLTPLSLDTLTIINVTHAGWAVSRLRIL